MTAADDSLEYFSFFSEKMRLDISCESSARQRIHRKQQALVFFLKDKSKLNVSSAAILLGSLRVNLRRPKKQQQ